MNTIQTNKTQVTEVAAVKIAQEDQKKLPELREKLYDWLKGQPGFLSWNQSQSVEDPEIIVDTLEWSSTTEAQAASEAMMASPAGQAYSAVMKEIVLFTHVKLVASTQMTGNKRKAEKSRRASV
jgi:quinol monooxygenase YgiN